MLLHGVGRVALFFVVQVPVMLLLALLFALALDSGLLRLSRVIRLGIFVPYAVPSVVAALMWGYLYGPDFGPFAHWHTLRFGAETYWGGILPHTGQPGRTYAELARLGAEFETAGSLVAGLEPDADITMVYSTPSKWLMQKYPPLAKPDGEPDPTAYHRIFDPFYRGAFDAGRQVRIVHARQLHDPSGDREGLSPEEAVRRHPVLVVPALYIAADSTLDWLAAYAHAGGHLVLGPRTGYADHEARARAERAPGRLTEAAGVGYDEFSNLAREVPVRPVPGGPLHLPEGATATRWADGLTTTDAEVLVTYDHPHFGRWPAVTTRRLGAGQVTYVGTVPGRDLGRAPAEWLTPSARHTWHDLRRP